VTKKSNSNSKPGQKPKPKSPVRMLDPVEILIQHEFVQMITEHFSDLWVSFDGDMSEMRILGIIGQTQLSMFLGQTEPVIFDASKHRGISASRISDVTKIPRQTVRRKLLSMEESGLLLQDEWQRWRLLSTTTAACRLKRSTRDYTRAASRGRSDWRSP
jgi:hypothetical protein